MSDAYFTECYRTHYNELGDEPKSLREVHAIRLAMDDERVKNGLSLEAWSKQQNETALNALKQHGLLHLKAKGNK